VARFNSFGAFIQIKTSFIGSDSPKIQGLIHISEFGSEDKMKEKLEIGKEYDFKF